MAQHGTVQGDMQAVAERVSCSQLTQPTSFNALQASVHMLELDVRVQLRCARVCRESSAHWRWVANEAALPAG